ncbi:hypothetical protein Air01nite_19930 [Asanoa iriomotensis]|uniref:HMA domain-containing protein n=2 Tax=Asanoa iriomotensis TaxID=234613 RepID=A0ABQ4BZF2_9ACTN|nr:hypothetical protein Air01nite_19930 [Asanoa iriomotensis]
MCDSCSCQPTDPAATTAGLGREFLVVGMTCASCAARVDAAVRRVSGVTGVEVDAASGRLTVAGDVDDLAVAAAVTAAGYRVSEP